MTIKGMTRDDVQQLATGITPAYLQRYDAAELVQELAGRLLNAERKVDELKIQLNECEARKNADKRYY